MGKKKCFIKYCPTNDLKGGKIRWKYFLRFPKRRSLKQKWLELIGKRPSTINLIDESSLLCCEHFDPAEMQLLIAKSGKTTVIELIGKTEMIPTKNLFYKKSQKQDVNNAALPTNDASLQKTKNLVIFDHSYSLENNKNAQKRLQKSENYDLIFRNLDKVNVNMSVVDNNTAKLGNNQSNAVDKKGHQSNAESENSNQSTDDQLETNHSNRNPNASDDEFVEEWLDEEIDEPILIDSDNNDDTEEDIKVLASNSLPKPQSPPTTLHSQQTQTQLKLPTIHSVRSMAPIAKTMVSIPMTSPVLGNVSNKKNSTTPILEKCSNDDIIEDPLAKRIKLEEINENTQDSNETTLYNDKLQQSVANDNAHLLSSSALENVSNNKNSTMALNTVSNNDNIEVPLPKQIKTEEMAANTQDSNEISLSKSQQPVANISDNLLTKPTFGTLIVKQEPDVDITDILNQEQHHPPLNPSLNSVHNSLPNNNPPNNKKLLTKVPKKQIPKQLLQQKKSKLESSNKESPTVILKPKPVYRRLNATKISETEKPKISLVPPNTLMKADAAASTPYPVNLIAVNPSDHQLVNNRNLSTVNVAAKPQELSTLNQSHNSATEISSKLNQTKQLTNNKQTPVTNVATTITSSVSLSSPSSSVATISPMLPLPISPTPIPTELVLQQPIYRHIISKDEEIDRLRAVVSAVSVQNEKLTQELARKNIIINQNKSQLKELIRVNIILSTQINPDCHCYADPK